MPLSSISEIRDTVYARYLSLLIRLILAGIFVVSAINKLPMRVEFVDIVLDFHLLPDFLASVYGFALPWVELLAGCYLLFGILVKPATIIVLLMSISFLVANITATITGNYYCPDCFGELLRLTVSQAIAIDVLIILASLMLLTLSGKREMLSFDSWFKGRFGKKLS